LGFLLWAYGEVMHSAAFGGDTRYHGLQKPHPLY
jgi:hypothetical protein